MQNLGLVAHAYNPSIQEAEKDHEFEASLVCIVRPYHREDKYDQSIFIDV
jgi:hypothetical protein